MGKAKRRSLNQGINNKFQYMTRESALDSVIKNMDNKNDVIDTITLFGFSAEEMLEAGAEYEDVMALGGLIN
ncbi:MAG: hypothetical protein E7Z92_07805 [Cyanobacteria bacterium SIG31]|nr:hypothetical protein [Cyanobacteria bacterium SIG31]